MALCWACSLSEYHDYKDQHGIRCPRCGQKEKDDPAKAKVVESKPAAKRAAAPTRRSK